MIELQKLFMTNLRAERTKAGLTQEALAEKVNVSHKYYGAIELGYKFPSIKVLESLAIALAIPPYKLFVDNTCNPDISVETIDKYNSYIENHLRDELTEIKKGFLKST